MLTEFDSELEKKIKKLKRIKKKLQSENKDFSKVDKSIRRLKRILRDEKT
jgi:hypothetical protein